MSVESMALVLRHSRSKGTDKVVLIGIANHDGDGGAWPAIATLARYANVSERTVQRSIESLVALGELEVLENAGGKAGMRADRRPNLYRITLDEVTPTSPRQGHGVTSLTPRGDIPDAHGVTPTSPEPSLEPSKEKTPPSPRERGAVDNPPRACTKHVRAKAYCADCQRPPAPPPPAWCGHCDPQGASDVGARMVSVIDADGTERWGICPRCHPVASRRPA